MEIFSGLALLYVLASLISAKPVEDSLGPPFTCVSSLCSEVLIWLMQLKDFWSPPHLFLGEGEQQCKSFVCLFWYSNAKPNNGGFSEVRFHVESEILSVNSPLLGHWVCSSSFNGK